MSKIDYMLTFYEIVGNGAIDMEATGKKLQQVIFEKGYTVKEIQEKLGFTCPNSIYRWFKGKTLPTLDHLYELSHLLRTNMENLIVPYGIRIEREYRIESVENPNAENRWKRMFAYYQRINQ